MTYAVFALATVHGLTAGTDTTHPWTHGLYLGAVGAVAFATAWRALAPPTTRRRHPKGALHEQVHRQIDASDCSGFGHCVDIAPELFELEAGVARVVVTETSDPAALDAAAACPMGAILVEEEAQAA